ncbi:MAG: ATP-binding protein [archaeon]
MAYDIIIGRNDADKKKFGDKGTIFLGRSYVKMGRTTSLSNNLYMDMVRSHVVYVAGKRGSGKSYSLGVIAEGMGDLPPEIKNNIAIVMLDTMGIYWTMKHKNEKDADLLEQWSLEPKGLDIKIFTPIGFYQKYKDQGIPTDAPFSIRANELTAEDWALAFGITTSAPVGIAIEKTLGDFKDAKKSDYTVEEMIEAIRNDDSFEKSTKNETINRLKTATRWGLFSDEGTKIDALIKGGQVTVLDVSCYATGAGGWGVKNLVVGLIAMKLFIERMISRKEEELEAIKEGYSYFQVSEESKSETRKPLVWLVIDEAHEALPRDGKTAATDALVTILREGRQPGISLILATQQPGKIHGDVTTQSDIVIAHRITAKSDVEALNSMTQSYLESAITGYLNNLPGEKGAAIILDDNSERIYPMRIRPRFSWHGGEAPTALKIKKSLSLGLD